MSIVRVGINDRETSMAQRAAAHLQHLGQPKIQPKKDGAAGLTGQSGLPAAMPKDWNRADDRGQTGLHRICRLRSRHLMPNKSLQALLECGANPNLQDSLGMTPLHYFLMPEVILDRADDEEVVETWLEGLRLLLQAGADTQVEDAQGRTPLLCLYHAAQGKLFPCKIEEGGPLIDRAASRAIDLCISDGRAKGNTEQGTELLGPLESEVPGVDQDYLGACATTLLEHGIGRDSGNFAFFVARWTASFDRPDLLERLIQCGAISPPSPASSDNPDNPATPAEQALSSTHALTQGQGDLSAHSLHSSHGVQTNSKYKPVDNLLHESIANRNHQCLALLLANGWDPQGLDEQGRTPMKMLELIFLRPEKNGEVSAERQSYAQPYLALLSSHIARLQARKALLSL